MKYFRISEIRFYMYILTPELSIKIEYYAANAYRISGKFGGLAVYVTTAKLKSAKISYSHIYIWQSHTEPPNLNPLIFLQ